MTEETTKPTYLKKIAELTEEEADLRRKKTRKSVRKSRRSKKTENVLLEAAMEQTKLIEHFPDENRISQYVRTVERKIAEELPELKPPPPDTSILREPEYEFVFYVASVCRGLEGFGVFVDDFGLKLGGVYGEAAAASVAEFIHENPRLLDSPTFSALYRQMLSGVLKFYEGLPNVDPKDLEIIRAELSEGKDNGASSTAV